MRKRHRRPVPSREVSGGGAGALARVRGVAPMSGIRVAYIDAYVLRPAGPETWDVLALRRAAGRSAGSWETVHGSIELGETPTEAALRELREETGLVPSRLYNVSRVESFYQHRTDDVALIPVFAAFVP